MTEGGYCLGLIDLVRISCVWLSKGEEREGEELTVSLLLVACVLLILRDHAVSWQSSQVATFFVDS